MKREEFDSKLKNMSFYAKEGKYLGYVISRDGIEFDKAKLI